MSLELDAREQALRDEVRGLAETYLRPHAVQADRIGDVPADALASPLALIAMRATVPYSFGGGWPDSGGGRFDVAGSSRLRVIVSEEAGFGDAALYVALPNANLALPIVDAFGTREQKERLFRPFVEEPRPRWAAFAMSEPGGGSDVSALRTTARKENGGYVLNGTKWFIGNGLRADWLVVFASTNPRLGCFGVEAFIVERGTPGFQAIRSLPSLGFRALQISELRFEDCRIPEENLLRPRDGRRKAGFDAGMLTFQRFRPPVAALAVGSGRAALSHAAALIQANGARHAAARRWRAMKRRLEELELELHAARLLTWKAACLADAGLDAFQLTCMAKPFAARVAMEACTAAMDAAGAAAASTELPLEKLYRDAKAFDLLEGTGDLLRLSLSRALTRDHETFREASCTTSA